MSTNINAMKLVVFYQTPFISDGKWTKRHLSSRKPLIIETKTCNNDICPRFELLKTVYPTMFGPEKSWHRCIISVRKNKHHITLRCHISVIVIVRKVVTIKHFTYTDLWTTIDRRGIPRRPSHNDNGCTIHCHQIGLEIYNPVILLSNAITHSLNHPLGHGDSILHIYDGTKFSYLIITYCT